MTAAELMQVAPQEDPQNTAPPVKLNAALSKCHGKVIGEREGRKDEAAVWSENARWRALFQAGDAGQRAV